MGRTHAGEAPRDDLAALGHELLQQTDFFVVDVIDLLDAELANLLAPEKLAATLAASARTAIGTVRTPLRAPGRGRCGYFLIHFVSHKSPWCLVAASLLQRVKKIVSGMQFSL